MNTEHRAAHRRVLATLSSFAAVTIAGSLLLATHASGDTSTAPADACSVQSHNCTELTACLGGALPDHVVCIEMSLEQARAEGVVLP